MPVATVESAFVLLDRASGPVRKIRRELRGMQRDAWAAGQAMDGLTGPRATKQVQGLEQEVSRARWETRQMRSELVHTDRQMAKTSRGTRRVAQDLRDLSTVIRFMRWPAMVAGAGAATQALGGVGAGAVSLVPKLGRASGAVVAGGNALVGYAAAAGVVKLATHDLTEAYGGNEKALKRLTPEARGFLQLLREQKKEVRELRREAQRGIFPGAEDLLGAVASRRGAARRIVRQTSGDVGGLARFGARQVRGPGFGRDMVQLADQGGRAFGAAARSGYHLAHATEQILLAGGPLTDWLGNTVEGWAKTADEQALVARRTGELDRWFRRTRDDVEDLLDVGKHTFGGLQGLMRASSQSGEDLWGDIDRLATRWDEWSNSIEGQTELRRWFDDVRPVAKETVGLVGDLGLGLAEIARSPGGVEMIASLRESIPGLADGVGELTANFGPAAVDALSEGVDLLVTLAGETGPLTLVAGAIGTVAHELNALLDALGPLAPTVTTLLATAAIAKRVGVGGGGGGGGAGAGLLGGMLLGRGGGRTAIGAGGAAAAAGGGMALGRVAATRAALGGAGAYMSGTYGLARSFGRGRAASAFAAGGGMFGLGGGVGGALGTAGRAYLPLALLGGTLGALGTEGDPLMRLQGGANAASMGLVPRPIGATEKTQAGLNFAGDIIGALPTPNSRRGQRGAIANLERQIRTLPGDDSLDQNKADLKAATRALEDELARRQQLLAESEQLARDTLRAQAVEHGIALAEDFGHAFRVHAKGPGGPVEAMERTVDDVLKRQERMRPAGAEILGESMLEWTREQERQNPKLKGAYDDLVSGIEKRFSRMGRRVQIVNGNILTGTQREWGAIAGAMSTATERARQEISEDFTAIQRQAVGSLTAMGYSPAQARQLVQSMEQGGRGGRAARQAARSGVGTRGDTSVNALLQGQRGRTTERGTGDGLGMDRTGRGAQVSLATTGSAAVGGLMGADADLGRYAAVGAKYGGRVSSGLRPGAITSSGNPSYHGSGDAIDIAGGNMLGAAQEIASVYGSGLEELIFTPLGWGIKNGKRVPLSTFGQAVIEDHKDHIHVADTDASGGPGAMLSMDTAGPGMMRVSLKGPKSRLRGVPGALSGAASGAYAAGLEEMLNKAIGGGAGAPGGGGSGDVIADFRRAVADFGATGLEQLALWEAGIVESGLQNLSYGDRDSVGPLQQRASQGWTGLQDPYRAAMEFLSHARGLGSFSGSAGALAQAVQRSAFPERYDQVAARARAYMGDGLGWARPSRGGGGARGGGGGAMVFPFAPSISVTGTDRQTIRREMERHLDRFVDSVMEQIQGGAGVDVEAAMA